MRQLFRGLLRLVTATKGALQTAQIERMAGERFDKVEHRQPYGLEAHPPAGARLVLASLDGTSGNCAILLADGVGKRPTTLAEGETALYGPLDTPDAGAGDASQRLQMMADGSAILRVRDLHVRAGERITLEAGGARIVIDGAGVRITGAQINLN